MSDYRVKITIRNDRILSKIEKMGFKSVMQFCKYLGMPYTYTNDIVSGKVTPFYEGRIENGLRSHVKKLLDYLEMTVEEAFTEKQLKGFSKNTFETKVEEEKLLQLVNPVKNLEIKAIESDVKDKINKILFKYLRPNERYVIARRFGFTEEDNPPYWEVGLGLNVTVERARQIEARGLQRLQNPKVKQELLDTGFYNIYTKVNTKENLN
jgi:hypothetical protein